MDNVNVNVLVRNGHGLDNNNNEIIKTHCDDNVEILHENNSDGDGDDGDGNGDGSNEILINNNDIDINYDSIYETLIHDAPYIEGDDGAEIDSNKIEWLNPKLIQEGQEFVKNNFFSLICAHLGALLYGFSFKSLSTVLLRTKKSNGVNDSMIRYLSTFIHLKTWYESDIIGKYKDGTKDIQRVRKMHHITYKNFSKNVLPTENDMEPTQYKKNIVHAIRKDLKYIHIPNAPNELLTYYPPVPMSQFDMVMTQFGVMSLVYLFPRTLGIKNTRGLHGFLHLWAVIGRLLGIQDRFNLALYPNRELYLKIFMNIGVASLKQSDILTISLQKDLVDGVAKYTNFMTVKSLLYFGLKTNNALPGYRGRYLYKIMSWKDFAYYLLMRGVLSSMYHCHYIRQIFNYVARSVLVMARRYYMPRRGKTTKA